MANLIIVLILVVIGIFAARSAKKHFNGEGSCCGGGGGSVKPLKKTLDKVVETQTFSVEGMHCENCANAVTQAINNIDGASAKVSLKKNEAKVDCDREIDPQTIIDAIEKKGYKASKLPANS